MKRLLSAAVIAIIAAGCSSEIDNKPAAEVEVTLELTSADGALTEKKTETTDEQGRPVVSPRVQNPSVILAGNAVLWTHVPGPGSAPAYDLIEVGEDAEHPNSRVLVSGDYYGRMLSTPGVWNIRALRKQPDGNFVEAQTFMVEVSHQHPDPPEPKVVALPGEGSDSIQLPPYSPLTFEVLEGEWYLTGERGPIESPTP